MARAKRSFAGKNASTSSTPTRFTGGRLDLLDQAGEVEVPARRPGGPENGGDEDVLAALHRVGLDAHQAEQARDRGADALAERLRVLSHRRWRRGEGLENGHRQAGIAARGVDGEVRRLAEPPDALAVLAPGGQALGPGLGLFLRERVGADALPPRVVLVDPGPEIVGAQLGKGEQEIAEIALGVDQQRGNAVERRLLEEGQAEAGLSAARHAHAYRVGHEILGVVEEEPLAGLPGAEVVGPPEIEDAELLEDLWTCGGRGACGGSGACGGRGGLRGARRRPWRSFPSCSYGALVGDASLHDHEQIVLVLEEAEVLERVALEHEEVGVSFRARPSRSRSPFGRSGR